MDQLAKLFGSALRVKIIRLFLFQEGEGYTVNEISERTQSKTDAVKKELKILEASGFLECKEFGEGYVEVLPEAIALKRKRSNKRTPSKLMGYMMNQSSPLIRGLRELLVDSNLITHKQLLKYFSGISYLKVVILSGVFVREEKSKADMLLVGEKIDQKRLAMTMKLIEAEIGKEIRYSVFTPEEFIYRISMYDKYVLDILSGKHEKLIQKIEIPKA